jgi:hypothetical protein
MSFFIRVKYLDHTGKEVGYWGSFKNKQERIERFHELGILNNRVKKLEVRRAGEMDFIEYDPAVIRGEEDEAR